MKKTKYEKQVEKLVRRRFSNNGDLLEFHIVPAVQFAYDLSDTLEADREIAVIGTWLHDIGKVERVKKSRKENNGHHIAGAKATKRILKGLKFPQDRSQYVESCVLRHSTDPKYPPITIEERIVADSDALSHLYNVPRLCQLAYGNGKSLTTGNNWLKEKCDSLISKITLPYALKLGEERYEEIKRLFYFDKF